MKQPFAATIALLLAFPVGAFPQTDVRGRIRARTELVVVPVTVKDSHGNLVPDLVRDDFRVSQDGVEQQIALFSAEAFPLSAVVLVDNDLSDRAAAQLQKSLRSIAGSFGPSDEAALMAFDEYPEPILDFTSNNDLLFAKLKRTELDSNFSAPVTSPMTSGPRINGQPVDTGVPSFEIETGGVTKRLDDAVHAAANMLRARGRDRRKIIFVISDGRNARRNQWSYSNTLELLLSSNISVYAVAVEPRLFHLEGSRLSRYAAATGGDIFYASKQGDLERLYSELTEEARNQYTIAFVPARVGAPKTYHTIEVRVERPDLQVIARQGYYTGVPQ